MTTYKSFADALSAPRATEQRAMAAPAAANDNKPKRIRNNTTLPALRWLYDNHPDLAPAMAAAVKALAYTEWNTEAIDNDMEIRPTVGELMRAAGGNKPEIMRDSDGNPYVQLGALKFVRGQLVEYGRTKKGRKLEPRDRIAARNDKPEPKRDARGYIALPGAVASPLAAKPYQRPISDTPAIGPMYDPLKGVEAARDELQRHGVDGGVPFGRLPRIAVRGKAVIAKGAEFLGGVVGSSGTSSKGAIMWEAPERPKGEVLCIVEEIASGATLKAIGERMGLKGGHGIRTAGSEIIHAAIALKVANDNQRKNIAA